MFSLLKDRLWIKPHDHFTNAHNVQMQYLAKGFKSTQRI